ncbi:MAG: ABC transporter ATP-binding protein [Spirochaetia bacterium]|nr:ABC transporter ATP-binding protein [Spirochaetia bacterium]
MSFVIEIENLTKIYGKFKAIDAVSLNVKKGEIYGFLGLNGAGKTTTIKSMLGLIWPTSGIISISGKKISPKTKGPWEKVGCLVETANSYPELTVRQNLEIFRRLRGLKIKQDPVMKIIDKLKLTRYTEKKAGQLSLGNQQRLGLAKAMMHKPEILILDEPANGLDPSGIVEIREMLIDLARNDNVTIFVSSHHLEEISKTADKIGIIHNGRLVQDISSSELEKLIKRYLVIKVNKKNNAIKNLKDAGYEIASKNDKNTIIVYNTKSIKIREEIVKLLVNTNNIPYEIKMVEEDLESYFLRIIKQAEQ